MRQIWMATTVAAITLAAGVAAAQTPPPPAPGGAFESLSPGNQKIALAIFDSERRAAPSASAKPLSLDQIAALKQGGRGWGQVFKEMKAKGLVQDKNLGQAVSRTHRVGAGSSATSTAITTASGRTVTTDGHDRSASASGQRGFGSDAARGDAGTAAAAGHGSDGGSGSSAARAGSGNHGGGRGK